MPKTALNYIDKGNDAECPKGTAEFIKEAIPDLKRVLLEITEDVEINMSGRRRIAMVYECVCDKFINEEDIDPAVPAKSVKIMTPIARKASKKAHRKRQKRRRARAEASGEQPRILVADKADSAANKPLEEDTSDVEIAEAMGFQVMQTPMKASAGAFG
ncbi:hypothetical protein EV182_005363 [Spiromyces aspiralis]|uniref:Uncharacterized protein n=1 Tax=Spiromyces aspiralis TaxID=68401 RepID=A0ACC1HHI7_9FUNG|nr:hypothetical protein EV182_005363 [Spiromyces aspiralis]